MLGYHDPGDGGGGEFFWDESSADADDGGLVFQPSSAPATGRWRRLTDGRRLSVQWFGATPDDLTDDRAAIQKAIHAAQSILAEPGVDKRVRTSVTVPAGEYRLSSALRILDGVDLCGDDASTTTFKSTGVDQDILRIENLDTDRDGNPDPLYDVSIRNLTLCGDGGPQGQNATTRFGLFMHHGIRGCTIEDVIVTRCETGIFLRRCWTAKVKGCMVFYCTQHALKWENATAGLIEGCRFDVVPGSNHCAFITFDYTATMDETIAFLVESSSFQGSDLAGLYCRDVGNISVVNCFFENNNRGGQEYAALHLEDVDNQPIDHKEHVLNVIGGFFTPGPQGEDNSCAIYAENTTRVNLVGVDVRGGNWEHAVACGNNVKAVNLVGCNFHGRPVNIPGGVTLNRMGSD